MGVTQLQRGHYCSHDNWSRLKKTRPIIKESAIIPHTRTVFHEGIYLLKHNHENIQTRNRSARKCNCEECWSFFQIQNLQKITPEWVFKSQILIKIYVSGTSYSV
jgi:lipoate synthase